MRAQTDTKRVYASAPADASPPDAHRLRSACAAAAINARRSQPAARLDDGGGCGIRLRLCATFVRKRRTRQLAFLRQRSRHKWRRWLATLVSRTRQSTSARLARPTMPVRHFARLRSLHRLRRSLSSCNTRGGDLIVSRSEFRFAITRYTSNLADCRLANRVFVHNILDFFTDLHAEIKLLHSQDIQSTICNHLQTAATLACNTRECRQCAGLLAARLRAIGLVSGANSLHFPFALPAAAQLDPAACRRLRLAQSVAVSRRRRRANAAADDDQRKRDVLQTPPAPSVVSWATAAISAAQPLRSTFTRQPQSAFASLVEQVSRRS